MRTIDPSNPDHRSIQSWMDEFTTLIASFDSETARKLFSPNVLGFGTLEAVAKGLDELQSKQWDRAWPNIREFRFDIDETRVHVSSDLLTASVVATWRSVGLDEEDRPFPRPGRATIVLQRGSPSEMWIAIHTHFSLMPDLIPKSPGAIER